MRVSYIDHETEDYIVACSYDPIPDLPDGGRALQTQEYREMPPAARKRLARIHMGAFRGDHDLRTARQMRNSMAHNIDTITGKFAVGTYVPPVRCSVEDINNARDAADRYILKTRSRFLDNPRYREWQVNRPATDVRPPPVR